jgi:hypothetical protein
MKVQGLQRITNGPFHHLVGFHDIDPWSTDGSKLLCIRVESSSDIPTSQTYAEIGYIDLLYHEFYSVGKTTGWNFPQGARQHWIRKPEGDYIIFNKPGDSTWYSQIVSIKGEVLIQCEQPIYAVSPCNNWGYGINFSRLYRLGGYGYPALYDHTKSKFAPKDDGIWQIDLSCGKARLLLSIDKVAETPGIAPVIRDTDHYVTHVIVSPDSEKLAFLHRYWLPDGGIQTRLMLHELASNKTVVWDEGFLSHFDWIDNDSILIWGRAKGGLQAVRSSNLLTYIPFAGPLLQFVKPIIRKMLNKKISENSYYKLVNEQNRFSSTMFSSNLTHKDGHPSFCPTRRHLLLADTYPDANGIRQLFVYNSQSQITYDLGSYKQDAISPNPRNLDLVRDRVDELVLKKFDKAHYVYSRSGIHCDLHPRWRSDGRYVCVDSNHEGSRQVYILNLDEVIPS